ncbi:MAG: TOBE domain-containing protein, partial [Burkholderiaceae bacterium]|nr:TOBE domain-containing protein [Burkholderiaceae bacterium]
AVPATASALQDGAVLGLRPEELALAVAGTAPASSPLFWRGVVQRIERLGAEAYAQVRLEEAERAVLVRTAADIAIEVGQDAILSADVARVRMFDGRSGAAVPANA